MAQYYCAPLTVALRASCRRRCARPTPPSSSASGSRALVPRLPEGTDLKKSPAQRRAWEFPPGKRPGLAGGVERAFRRSARRPGAGWPSATWFPSAPAPRTRDPFLHTPVTESTPHGMNPEQLAALALIGEETAAEKPRVVLLHGVTGSGKTEVYLPGHRPGAGGRARRPGPRARDRPHAPDGGAVPRPLRRPEDRRGRPPQPSLRRRAPTTSGSTSAPATPASSSGPARPSSRRCASSASSWSTRSTSIPTSRRNRPITRPATSPSCAAISSGSRVVLGSATPSLESYHHAREGKYRLAQPPLPGGGGADADDPHPRSPHHRQKERPAGPGRAPPDRGDPAAARAPGAVDHLSQPPRLRLLAPVPPVRPRRDVPELQRRADLPPPRGTAPLPSLRPRRVRAARLPPVRLRPLPLHRQRHGEGRAGAGGGLPAGPGWRGWIPTA